MDYLPLYVDQAELRNHENYGRSVVYLNALYSTINNKTLKLAIIVHENINRKRELQLRAGPEVGKTGAVTHKQQRVIIA
jgi:hypothetical protein